MNRYRRCNSKASSLVLGLALIGVLFFAGSPISHATPSASLTSDANPAEFTLTVNGQGFINGTVVRWNGSNRITTYKSGTQLMAAIRKADIATASAANVTVLDPGSGGGPSNAAPFIAGVSKRVYLPLVRMDVSPPVAPGLNAIANADGDGDYAVGWNAVAGATLYTLEESDNADFAFPVTQYAGAGTSWNAAGQAAGTYYYRVKANNTAGSSGWSNVQSTTVRPGCQNPILNPGFESGEAYWEDYSSNNYLIILPRSKLPAYASPHDGDWAAWVGGLNDEISYIQQTIGVSCPYLVYWHWIDSEDPTCGHDFARVLVNGNAVNQYDLCVNSNTGGWVKHVVNLDAYVGQTVDLQIRAQTDSSLISDLLLDDISLQPTAMAAAAVTRSSSAADSESKPAKTGP